MADIGVWVAGTQAVYFLLTGVWPLVHVRSFMAVTGPKHDVWLVKTVGVIVGVIGLALGVAALRRDLGPEVMTLAVGSASGLAAVDVVYVAKRVIAPIYLLDAAAEAVLVAGWACAAVWG